MKSMTKREGETRKHEDWGRVFSLDQEPDHGCVTSHLAFGWNSWLLPMYDRNQKYVLKFRLPVQMATVTHVTAKN